MFFIDCLAYENSYFQKFTLFFLSFSGCLTCAVYPTSETFKVFPRIASSLTASQERLESVT